MGTGQEYLQNRAKAKVFTGAKLPFENQTVVLPTPSRGEVLVKIEYTTICTSDLHTFCGRRKAPCPSILGHEIIGTIVTLGKGDETDFSGNTLGVGDRVTWAIYAYGKQDPMAKKGYPQKAGDLYKYGHQDLGEPIGLSGGFATHCLLKAGTALFKLKANMPAVVAAPLNCTHATIAGALRLAGNLQDKVVAVVGVGMLGLAACAMAKARGASKVLALDVDENRLAHALKFGGDCAVLSNIGLEGIRKEFQQTVDVVVDTSGNPGAMELGISVLGIGGTAVWVGAVYQAPKTQLDAETIVRKLLSIKGLHNYRPEDLETAIDFMEKHGHAYPFQSLVGAEYDLDDLDAAFAEANSGAHYRVGVRQ